MLELPVELQRNCIEFLSSHVTTLKAVRLVNKLLNELASETLFHTVSFTNNKNSPPRFTQTANSSLRKHIRHVIITTSDDHDPGLPIYRIPTKILGAFKDAIELLPQLERMERVDLKFSSFCIDHPNMTHTVLESVDFRREITDLCFQALAQCEKIKSLMIKNLHDAMDGLTHPESFLPSVRGRLTELHLEIIPQEMEAGLEELIDNEALHRGLSCYLPNLWLKPTTNQLARLTLDCDVFWGVWPLTDFRQIPPFPHLKSLFLARWTIAHDWQVDWIVAHGATLEALTLHCCFVVRGLHMNHEQAEANFPQLVQPGPTFDPSILGIAPSYEWQVGGPEYFVKVHLRWHQMLERFRVGLQRLRHFALNYTWPSHTFESRYDLRRHFSGAGYIFFDYTILGYACIDNPWDFYNTRDYIDENGDLLDEFREEVDWGDEKDERAFVALAETVQQRTSTITE
jgi:hypothetical protein